MSGIASRRAATDRLQELKTTQSRMKYESARFGKKARYQCPTVTKFVKTLTRPRTAIGPFAMRNHRAHQGTGLPINRNKNRIREIGPISSSRLLTESRMSSRCGIQWRTVN